MRVSCGTVETFVTKTVNDVTAGWLSADQTLCSFQDDDQAHPRYLAAALQRK